MGMGMSVGVSSQAYPNIMPWSPAPIVSTSSWIVPVLCSIASLTPMAMSGLWDAMAICTPQVLPSKPFSLESKPISLTTWRTRSSKFTKAVVVISPRHMTKPVLIAVSQATRAMGSWAMMASNTASLIWSHILSGCPSVTDSEVKSRLGAVIKVVIGFVFLMK